MITMSLAPARLPAGQRVYAIGDVHGCSDRLAVMHQLIARDLAGRPVAEPTVVHLGDYIDRGEDSAGVIDLLLRGWPAPAPRCINLLGNHEDMMLRALQPGDVEAVADWLSNGGASSLESWGVPRRARAPDWHRSIPPAHVAFLRALPLHHVQGGYLFVHAGLRPGVPLARQSRHDMLWIREPFLSWTGALPFVVVHGHTPAGEPTIRHNRIGIDTGAVLGGRLTCAVLESDSVGFLQV